MTSVARYFDPTEAQVACGAARSCGDDASLENQYLCGVNWLYLSAVGGLRLAVRDPEESLPMLSLLFTLVDQPIELGAYDPIDASALRLQKTVAVVAYVFFQPLFVGIVVALEGLAKWFAV